MNVNLLRASLFVTFATPSMAGCATSAAAPVCPTTATATATGAAEQLRLDPDQIRRHGHTNEVTAGTSGVTGIETSPLKGEASHREVYTVVLRVPANTRIEAHAHPDDRVATVLSGTWNFGYGDHFDATKLIALPPGSYYTEPPNVAHFAMTGNEAAVVLITGYGPTGTHYVNPTDDPRTRSK